MRRSIFIKSGLLVQIFQARIPFGEQLFILFAVFLFPIDLCRFLRRRLGRIQSDSRQCGIFTSRILFKIGRIVLAPIAFLHLSPKRRFALIRHSRFAYTGLDSGHQYARRPYKPTFRILFKVLLDNVGVVAQPCTFPCILLDLFAAFYFHHGLTGLCRAAGFEVKLTGHGGTIPRHLRITTFGRDTRTHALEDGLQRQTGLVDLFEQLLGKEAIFPFTISRRPAGCRGIGDEAAFGRIHLR